MNATLRSFVEEQRAELLPELQFYMQELNIPERLKEAMEYSLMAAGKRLRPIFLLSVIDALGKNYKLGYPAACALEMVHTYSLIHDDLPSMDNDDYRRGRKTNHKVFGDAMAILAGDALLTHAFYILAHPQNTYSALTQVQMIRELSLASGAQGMVAGQVADLLGEEQQLSYSELQFIHEHKTADLLICSVRMGCIAAQSNAGQLQHLTEYARHIGMAFQIQDDILDEIGDEHKLGKPVGSDRTNGKTTYVSILGLEGAKRELDDHVMLAKKSLQLAQVQQGKLLELADYMVSRDM